MAGGLRDGVLGGAIADGAKGVSRACDSSGQSATVQKIELGRHLFYDRRMSVNGTTSCGTCHRQELAFTDGKGRAVGATGEQHRRGSMSLVNVAWNAAFEWSDRGVRSLEEQALRPMMSTSPVELGYGSVEKQFLAMARGDRVYGKLFPKAFPGERDPWTTANVVKAIASFERTIVSRGSDWIDSTSMANRARFRRRLSAARFCFSWMARRRVSGATGL